MITVGGLRRAPTTVSDLKYVNSILGVDQNCIDIAKELLMTSNVGANKTSSTFTDE